MGFEVTIPVSGFGLGPLGFLFAPRTSNGVAMGIPMAETDRPHYRPPAPLLLITENLFCTGNPPARPMKYHGRARRACRIKFLIVYCVVVVCWSAAPY